MNDRKSGIFSEAQHKNTKQTTTPHIQCFPFILMDTKEDRIEPSIYSLIIMNNHNQVVSFL